MFYEVFRARCINIPMSLNGKERIYISIRLDCIWWFKRCQGWMCLYIYIHQSGEIFVCLYDQVFTLLIFMFDLNDFMFWCACILVFSEVVEYMYVRMIDIWCHWFSCWDVCMHTCILWSSGIFVCLYNYAMRSLIFMLRDACMLVLPKVVECLYTSIVKSLDIYV
jgi:hypothetical protein